MRSRRKRDIGSWYSLIMGPAGLQRSSGIRGSRKPAARGRGPGDRDRSFGNRSECRMLVHDYLMIAGRRDGGCNSAAIVAIVNGFRDSDPDVEQPKTGDNSTDGTIVKHGRESGMGTDKHIVVPAARPPWQHHHQHPEIH